MNIFKKLNLYFKYRSSVLKNKKDLFIKFNIKVDMVNRMYTVVNIPDVGEPYNMRRSDLEKISEEHMKGYFQKLSEYFNSIGLSEIYDIDRPIERLDKMSYLVVIGYKFINLSKMHFWALTALITSLTLVTIIYSL